jgi:uncharacterized protein
MTIETGTSPAIQGQNQSSYIDLALYLLAGFGLFIVASLVLSRFSKIGTLADSSARYLLNFLIFAGAFYFLGIRRGKISWQSVGMALSQWRSSFLLVGPMLAIGVLPIRGVLGLVAQQWFGGGIGGLQFRTEIITGGGYTPLTAIVTLMGAGILAPIAEELYFRGLLHTWFQSHAPFWPRVLASSFLFALGHIDSIGVVVSAFVMGIVIAIAFERTRSIWLPIVIHAVTNSFAVIVIFAALAMGLTR